MKKSTDEDRVTYFSIKEQTLNCYFDGCRDQAIKKKWTHTQVLAYVSYMYEDGFSKDSENLMWAVALLILGGGWDREWDLRWRKSVTDIINTSDINALVKNIGAEESDELLRDLGVLGFI